MAEYRLVSRLEHPSTVDGRQGKVDVAYVYQDEKFQSFMFSIPIEEDSPDRVKAELQKRAEAAAGAGPKVITL